MSKSVSTQPYSNLWVKLLHAVVIVALVLGSSLWPAFAGSPPRDSGEIVPVVGPQSNPPGNPQPQGGDLFATETSTDGNIVGQQLDISLCWGVYI